MKINNFISLHPEDLSPMHLELVSIYDAFIVSASTEAESKQFEILFKQEYPTIMRLKNLVESILIGQQNLGAYERIKDPKKKESRIVKLKIIKREVPPDEPA